jgi:hypothetical protein
MGKRSWDRGQWRAPCLFPSRQAGVRNQYLWLFNGDGPVPAFKETTEVLTCNVLRLVQSTR